MNEMSKEINELQQQTDTYLLRTEDMEFKVFFNFS